VELTPAAARWRLRLFQGDLSHSLVFGLKPGSVRVDGTELERSAGPVRLDAGWWWDEEKQRLYLTIPHQRETVQVDIVRQ
jgi:hypothetical protein